MATTKLKFSSWRFRKTKGFYSQRYRELIDEELKHEQQMVLNAYKRISDKFQTPVDYQLSGPEGTSSRSTTVSTSDNPLAWLDKGTHTRWALMSNPYRPQTTPYSTRVLSKSGYPVIRGQTAMQARGIGARPGIKPRHFTKVIKERRERFFGNRVQQAINKAAKG